MPKDKIEDTTSGGWYAEVSWRRKPDGDDRGSAEGHVQLATVNLHSPFEFPDIDTRDHFEAGERFDGWRVTLDEAGIDRLIKALHKAKRQAFGGPMASRVDAALRDYAVDTEIRGVDPTVARRRAWSEMGYSDQEIVGMEDAGASVIINRGQRTEGGPVEDSVRTAYPDPTA